MLCTPDGTNLGPSAQFCCCNKDSKQTNAFWKWLGDLLREEMTRMSKSLNLFNESPNVIFIYSTDDSQE